MLPWNLYIYAQDHIVINHDNISSLAITVDEKFILIGGEFKTCMYYYTTGELIMDFNQKTLIR